MASPSKIVFKVVSGTASSDFIQFDYDGNTYKFLCLNTSKYPTPFTFISSSDNNTSADRIKNSVNSSLSELTATVEGSVVTIQVNNNSGLNITNGLVGASGRIELVETIADGSTGSLLGTDSVIEITLFQHEVKEFYPAQPRDFLYGNHVDEITTTITFTTALPIQYINFRANTIEAAVDVYSQGTNDYSIDDEFFRSSVSDDLMQYTGTFGVLSTNNPKSGIDGTVVFTDLGGNNYSIVHTHIQQRVIRTEDLNGTLIITPEEYNGFNTLKYIFSIDLRDDLVNPEPLYSTKDVDLTPYIKPGNVGFNDEFLNGNTPNYILLGDFVFQTGNEQIDRNQDSLTTFQIKNNVGNFTASTKLRIFIQEVKDNYDTLLTLQENLNIDRLVFDADGSSNNSINIIDAQADLNVDNSILDVQFKVPANTINGDYYISIAVSNDNSNVNHNNIFLQSGVAGLVADETTINFNTYPDAPRFDYNFNYHYNNDIANSYNEVVSCVEDRIVARFRVVDSAILPISNTLTQFEIQLKNRITGEVFTSYIVTAEQLPIDTNRGFKLEDTDLKNTIDIQETSPNNWDFVYGFQIWERWVDQNNLVLSTLCTFSQLTQTGEDVVFTKEFQSPDFIMWTYDTTINTILEPQVLRSPESIQFFDNLTSTLVSGIVKNRDTRIYATFQDDNLNDLQVTLASELAGYIGVNSLSSNQFNYEMFHSTVSNGAERPFEQVSGFPNFNSLITILSVKKCSIEAVLVWDKLISLFPSDEKFRVSARIDKIVASAQTFSIFTDIDSSINTFIGQVNSPLPVTYLFEDNSTFVGTPPLNSLNTNANGLNGTVQEVEILCDDLSSITLIQFNNVQIVQDVDSSLLTQVDTFEFTGNSLDNVDFADNAPITDLNLSLNSGAMTIVDLSNTDIGGVVDLQADLAGTYTKLTNVILPPSNSNVFTSVNMADNALITLDASGLSGFAETLLLQRNNLLLLQLHPNSIVSPTNFNVSFNSLLDLDLSGYPSMSGNIFIQNNGMITFTQPQDSGTIGNFWFNDNAIVIMDLSNMSGGIGNLVQGQRNSLTSITFPNSTAPTSNMSLAQQTGGGPLTFDFSPLLGLRGSLQIQTNSNTENVIFGNTTAAMTLIRATNCNLGYVDFTPLFTSNGVTIELQNNNMVASEVNHILVDLDSTGWTGGLLNISGTNSAPDGVSGGFDGLTAITNLTLFKGWTIFTS